MSTAGKVATAIATILTAAVVTVAVEGGTYLATGGGLNPVDGATVAAFIYFDESIATPEMRQEDSYKAIDRFLSGRADDEKCHLVYAYNAGRIPLVNKKIAVHNYIFYAEGERIPEFTADTVLYDYAAVRGYLKAQRELRKTKEDFLKKPADISFSN